MARIIGVEPIMIATHGRDSGDIAEFLRSETPSVHKRVYRERATPLSTVRQDKGER